MQLSSYKVVLDGGNGYVHVDVTCDDGSTFGQWIKSGTPQEMDTQVNDAVTRVAAQSDDQPAPAVTLGMSRSAADMDAGATVTQKSPSTNLA